jgi:3-hydroxymyristoyl/3-hydroxydecanoyl-(acyl carrier protein) dehydratase
MRFLFVDRIVEQIPGEVSRGIKHITADDSFLYPEDNGRASFVPSLIGETLGQLAAWNVMAQNDFSARPVAGVVASAAFYRPAYVGETLLLESFIEQLDDKAVQYHSKAYIAEELVFSVDGAIGPFLPMTQFINQDEVINQFNEIYRPGDWQTLKQQYIEEKGRARPIEGIRPLTAVHFDRCYDFEPGQGISAEKKISRAATYLADHFPKKPVLPMTILLECKINLAKAFIQLSGYQDTYRFQSLRKIKMNDFVQPGDHLKCQLKVKEHSDDGIVFSFRSTVNQKRVCVAEALFSLRG